jgi:hypothetical protein
MPPGYSKKSIPPSEDSTFWSTTLGSSASAPSREITEESFHLHYNINVLGAILGV